MAARLCENVGALDNLGPDAHPKVLTLNERVDAAAAGFGICAQGPDAMREVYDTVRRRSQSTKGGFYADFGFYSCWLQRLTQPQRQGQILDHFRALLLENYDLAPGDRVLGQVCKKRRWFAWEELGRTCGLTFGRISAPSVPLATISGASLLAHMIPSLPPFPRTSAARPLRGGCRSTPRWSMPFSMQGC